MLDSLRTMTIQYFFACSYPLEVGSVILPGNWGRVVGMYTTKGFGNAWIQYREDVFERVRLDEFPNLPSRLKSIFLFESVDLLREFLRITNRFIDIIYEVSLIDVDEPVHRGFPSLLDFQQKEGLDSFTQKARTYWSGTEISSPEIVTTSRVQIEARF